jgi:hypothetical protein
MLASSKVVARIAPNFGEVELEMQSYNSKLLGALLVCKQHTCSCLYLKM